MNLVPISEIFDIEYGNQLDLNKLEQVCDGVAFVSRSSQSNGYKCDVSEISETTPYDSGLITVTMGGTYLLSAFVQPRPFYTAQNIKVLTPKIEMSLEVRLAYCAAISANRFRYVSHGREANSTFDRLLVPQTDYLHQEISNVKVCRPSKHSSSNSTLSLEDRDWKSFKAKCIFNLKKGKCSNASGLLIDGVDVNYVGAKKDNNGIMRRVSHNSGLISEGNCIIFIGDGQGSVGYSLYQPEDFIGSSTLICGYNSKLTAYSGLFLVTVLDLNRYRYSFGRKYNKKILENSTIKLPVTEHGEPDWQFMEDYIKSLPYSSNL